MKKIIFTLLTICMVGSSILLAGTYELILNGTTVEVWLNPGLPAGTTVIAPQGNQVDIVLDAGFGASVSVTQNYWGTWGDGTNYLRVAQSAGMDYVAIGSSAGGNPMAIGSNPVHLFDLSIVCSTGDVSLMDNNDPNRPSGLNYGNVFNVVAIPGGPMNLYNGNAGVGITCAGALPVELFSFTGKNTPQGNLLQWKTLSESDNAGFEVYKSTDGQSWKNIGWVVGSGTTDLSADYELLDRAPSLGDNYYRLKQIDFDGEYEFSQVINVKYLSEGVLVQVTPNPSPQDIKVTILNPHKEKMLISLFDSAGMLIWKSEGIQGVDLWKKHFSLPQKEVYFLYVRIGKEVYTKKILIVDRA